MEYLIKDYKFRGFKFEISRSYGLMGYHPDLQLDAVARIADRYAGIRFVIEHLFFPGAGHVNDVRTALFLLAPFENVFFTIASIPNSTMPEPYPFPSACRFAGVAKDVVGADRILWGSDLPSVAVNATYREFIDYIAESGVFSDGQLRKIHAENAIRVYGLEEPPVRPHG